MTIGNCTLYTKEPPRCITNSFMVKLTVWDVALASLNKVFTKFVPLCQMECTCSSMMSTGHVTYAPYFSILSFQTTSLFLRAVLIRCYYHCILSSPGLPSGNLSICAFVASDIVTDLLFSYNTACRFAYSTRTLRGHGYDGHFGHWLTRVVMPSLTGLCKWYIFV